MQHDISFEGSGLYFRAAKVARIFEDLRGSPSSISSRVAVLKQLKEVVEACRKETSKTLLDLADREIDLLNRLADFSFEKACR